MLIPSQSIALNLQELLVLQEFCNILHIDDEHSHDNSVFPLGRLALLELGSENQCANTEVQVLLSQLA